jgi:hypothetical protein
MSMSGLMEIKGRRAVNGIVADIDLRRHIAAAIDDHQSRGARRSIACMFASTGFAVVCPRGGRSRLPAQAK